MKVNLVTPCGFCQGVYQAIEMAKKVRQDNPTKNIYIFGMLVHNRPVINELSKMGIHTIDINQVNPIERLNEFVMDDIVIFTAHGHNPEYDRILDKNHITHYDAVCQQVKRNLTLIDYYRKQSEVIYIGKQGHPETEAALSLGANIFLYDIKKKIDYSLVTCQTPLVTNQTTLSYLELETIHQDITKHFPKAVFVDEICKSTGLRQKAVQAIPQTATTIIIIGSVESSNTEKLYQMSKDFHPKTRVIKIEDVDSLESITFEENEEIYLASGASTSKTIINAIKQELEAK